MYRLYRTQINIRGIQISETDKIHFELIGQKILYTIRLYTQIADTSSYRGVSLNLLEPEFYI